MKEKSTVKHNVMRMESIFQFVSDLPWEIHGEQFETRNGGRATDLTTPRVTTGHFADKPVRWKHISPARQVADNYCRRCRDLVILWTIWFVSETSVKYYLTNIF